MRRVDDALGHAFADPTLLVEALTHRSAVRGSKRLAVARSNQRFEFLGDRVLDLVVAGRLCADYPDLDEGELTRRLNALVRTEALAEIGAALGVGEWLILGGDQTEDVRHQTRTLAETTEALVAAIFLDGGLEAATAFVERCWGARLRDAEQGRKEPKIALQEWSLARGAGLPDYRLVEHRPDPQRPHFIVEVSCAGATMTGEGGSKRAAEQDAAARLLGRLEEAA